jgi:hypothetical protein
MTPSLRGVCTSRMRGVRAPLIFAPRGPFASGDGGVLSVEEGLPELSATSGAVGGSGERVK